MCRQVIIFERERSLRRKLLAYFRGSAFAARSFISAEPFFREGRVDPDCLMLVSLDIYGRRGALWRYAGFEVLQEMRRRCGRTPKILMMLQDSSVGAAQACWRNGADDVIFKHRNVKKIIKQLERAMFQLVTPPANAAAAPLESVDARRRAKLEIS